ARGGHHHGLHHQMIPLLFMALVVIDPQPCVPVAAGRAVRLAPLDNTIQSLLRRLASLGCESFAVPEDVLYRTVGEFADAERTVAQHRRRLMELLKKEHISARPTTRLVAAPDPETVSDEDLEQGIRCQERRCTVDHRIVEKYLAHPEPLATAARFV